MLKQKTSSKRGFTIIEVVLVLAIAGLIFLMVFLALPALQRSQRDTQRRSAYSEFLTQISNYQSNNRGRLPGGSSGKTEDWENFITAYMRPTENCTRKAEYYNTEASGTEAYESSDLDDPEGCSDGPATFLDPVGEPYYIGDVIQADDVETKGGTPFTWDKNKYQIYVYLQSTCDGETAKPSDGARNVAIRVKLEGGGIYCGNN